MNEWDANADADADARVQKCSEDGWMREDEWGGREKLGGREEVGGGMARRDGVGAYVCFSEIISKVSPGMTIGWKPRQLIVFANKLRSWL